VRVYGGGEEGGRERERERSRKRKRERKYRDSYGLKNFVISLLN
jgi:hypothetical protein